MAMLIETRNRKALTARQYVALKRMRDAAGAEHPCVHGHFECAAWDDGPCIDEVLGSMEPVGERGCEE